MHYHEPDKANSNRRVLYQADDLVALQSQHLINKERFNLRFYKMHPIQFTIENILLGFEEEVYFKRQPQKKIQRERIVFERQNLMYEELKRNKKCFKAIRSTDKDTSSNSNHKTTSREKSSKSKIYKCEVKNCSKTYTSAYGLRYHTDRGHRVDTDESKPYFCTYNGCKKRYKNANGLKYHSSHSHN